MTKRKRQTPKKSKKGLDKIKPPVNLFLRTAHRLPDVPEKCSYPSRSGILVLIYVDDQYAEDLRELLQDEKIKKKFRQIVDFARADRHDDDIYGSEKNSEKSKDVYAMKICVKGNYRIYTKEFGFPGTKRIVLIKHISKKKNNFNAELRNLVDKIGVYQYEFED